MKVKWGELVKLFALIAMVGVIVFFKGNQDAIILMVGILANAQIITSANNVRGRQYILCLVASLLLVGALFLPVFFALLMTSVSASLPLLFMLSREEGEWAGHKTSLRRLSSAGSMSILFAVYYAQPAAPFLAQKLFFIFSLLQVVSWPRPRVEDFSTEESFLRSLFGVGIVLISAKIFNMNIGPEDALCFSLAALIVFFMGSRENALGLLLLSTAGLMPSMWLGGLCILASLCGRWPLRIFIFIFMLIFSALIPFEPTVTYWAQALSCAVVLGGLWTWDFPNRSDLRFMELTWTALLAGLVGYFLTDTFLKGASAINMTSAIPAVLFIVSAVGFRFWRPKDVHLLERGLRLIRNQQRRLGEGVQFVTLTTPVGRPLPLNFLFELESKFAPIWATLFIILLWGFFFRT